jgi:chromosome segregation ATPase
MLAGAHEVEVSNQQEMIAILERGTCLRATGATGMNQRSSRSHAIFTITVEQRTVEVLKAAEESTEDTMEDTESEDDEDAVDDSYLCAKMHLVDLAGSERVKRTKSEGQRLQEGIKINKGLLALGNVINALSENKQHVPYRDSKLTRMLQDSLGGNSRTLMVACVSPADVNLEESLNTLRYASRARAIKNKPIVNRDPVAAQISALRHQLALARAENADLRKKLNISPNENLQDQHDVEELQVELESTRDQLARLTLELGVAKRHNEELKKDLKEQAEEALIAAMQRDKMAQALSAHVGEDHAAETIAKIGASSEINSLESSLLKKMQQLEEENRRLRAVESVSPPCSPLSDGHAQSSSSLLFSPKDVHDDVEEDEDEDEEAFNRKKVIDSMNAEMNKLQSVLEAKEAAIRKVTSHASMQVAYQAHLKEIQQERDSLAKERTALLNKIKDLQSASAEERSKLERMYKSKLRELDLKVKAAEKREQKIRSLEATQMRASQKVKDLEGEIQSIKTQKANLQRQADKAGKEYVQWKRQRDREVQKLKKENQTTAVRLLKMEAQSARQQAYLRRKIEEAAAARKRLANLEGRRQAARGVQPKNTSTHTTTKSARLSRSASEMGEWVENELDACCSSIELQKVLEGEKASRSDVAQQLRQVEKKIAALKNPKWWGLSPGGNKDQKQLQDLKKSLMEKSEYHGKQIQDLQLQLMRMRAAEEERGEGAADPKRWDDVDSIEEARSSLTTLFMAASKYKTQAYESQSSLAELSEEVEMLKLKLEVAEAERLEQSMQLDQMKKQLSEPKNNHVSFTTPPPPRKVSTDDTEIKEVLHELDSVKMLSSEHGDRMSDASSTATELLPGEIAALGHLNTVRASQGLSPVYKLRTGDMKQKLEGIKLVTGELWQPGSKSKAEIISDYLALVVSREKKASRSNSTRIVISSPKGSPALSHESISSSQMMNGNTADEYMSSYDQHSVGDAKAHVTTTQRHHAKISTNGTGSLQSTKPAPVKKKIWIPTS